MRNFCVIALASMLIASPAFAANNDGTSEPASDAGKHVQAAKDAASSMSATMKKQDKQAKQADAEEAEAGDEAGSDEEDYGED